VALASSSQHGAFAVEIFPASERGFDDDKIFVRGPEQRLRGDDLPIARFGYLVFMQAKLGVGEADGGYTVTLDGKPIKTPSGRTVVVPVRSLAEMIAAEWNAQGEFIEPLTMPLTRFANSVVQGVVDQSEAVKDDVAKYFASDLLFYRAGHPEGLVAREAQYWDPILFWAKDALGAHFILAEGVMHVRLRLALTGDIEVCPGSIPGFENKRSWIVHITYH